MLEGKRVEKYIYVIFKEITLKTSRRRCHASSTVLPLQRLQILFCHEMLENLPYLTSRYCDPSLEWAIDLTSSQERLLVLENKII